MTTNEFTSPFGGGYFAFDRIKMISGDPAPRCSTSTTLTAAMLPSDLDGPLPPAGSPNYFLELVPTQPPNWPSSSSTSTSAPRLTPPSPARS